MAFEEFLFDVRPEFFQNLGDSVDAALLDESYGIASGFSSIRIVRIRDCRSGGVSDPVRIIEAERTGIRMGHENAGDGVIRP